MNYLLLSFLSFFVGIIVGLTGIGGASLITPMLIFLFQVPASIAISSDVVAASLMKMIGGFKHWHQKTVELEAVKWLACGSVPGSFVGISLLHELRRSHLLDLDRTLVHLLGVLILFIASTALIQLCLLTFAPELQLPNLPKLDLGTWPGTGVAIAIGSVLGCLVGMTSLSSGSLFALVLIAFFQLDTQKLVGTDMVQAAILLGFTSLGHFTLGTVDWSIVAAIWLGSVPGVLIGARLCSLAPQRPLRFLIYSLLVMVSWKLAHPF